MDSVPVICEGWAASTLMLSNGRRQILSFLLPGEMITAGLLFERQLHCTVISITRCCYRNFDRSQLRDAMFHSEKIFDRILRTYNVEKRKSDQLITDLGQRTASERVARLILDIWGRSEKLGMVKDDRIEFPLRQSQIADATGLTNVYASKILGDLRKNGLIDISGRSLQIIDMTKLRRLAQ